MKVIDDIESLIPKVLASAGPAVATLALDEAKLCYSFDDDLDYLKRSKILLEDQLKYAEKRYLQHRVRISINNASTGGETDPWESIANLITLMKSTNYDIEDVITDSYHLKEKSEDRSCLEKVESFFSCDNPIVTKVMLIERMRSVRKNLQIIQSDMSLTRKLPISGSSGSSYLNVSTPIIGREVDLRRIMDLLKLSSNEAISIIPILGPVGIGKSSIACVIYFDSWVQKEFNHRIWLSLAMDTVDVKGIAKQIISKVGESVSGNIELKSTLHHVLKEQSCFIVLDGLWAEDQRIIELKQMLQTGSASRSKIIVTTHSDIVANLMASAPVYRLQPLSDDYCSTIFQDALRYQSEHIETYRDAVAAKCEGSPLVAKFLGSVVDSGRGSLDTWKSAKETQVWKLEERTKQAIPVLQSFRQIYYNMPPNLRKCFIYCSLFSLGSDLDKEKVARQWITLGLVATDSLLPQELTAKFYVEDMQALFFFDDVDDAGNHGPPSKVMRMHTLAYNLARSVAREDMLVLSEDGEIHKDTHYCNYRYGQLSTSDLQSIDRKSWPHKARALILKCSETDVELLSKVITANKFLRVLDLRGCIIRELPSSIFGLRYLKYLDVSGLPISEFLLQRNCLEKLETLDLSETELEELPSSISDLKQLSYLSLKSCHKLVALPSSFGMLSKLHYLDLSHCFELRELPVSFGNLKIRSLYLIGCQDSIIRAGSSNNNLEVSANEAVRNYPENPQNLPSEPTRSNIEQLSPGHQLTSSESASASLSSFSLDVEHTGSNGSRTGVKCTEQYQRSEFNEDDLSLSNPYRIHQFWTKRQP